MLRSHLLATISLLFVSSILFAQEPSVWGGWTEVDGERDWIQLNVDTWKDDGITIDLFGPRMFRQPVSDVERDLKVRFLVDVPLGDIEFEGTFSDRCLDGDLVLQEKKIGRFHLTKFHHDQTVKTNRFLGTYRTAQGERIIVVRRSLGGLRVIERRNGSWTFDAFLPWKENCYFESTVESPCLPPSRWIELGGDDGASFPKLSVHQADGNVVEYISTNEIRVKEIVVENDGITLPGMLMLPPGKGPFPVMIWNHGSGPVTADAPWDLFHAVKMVEELNLAVLSYDKRGSGRANGNEETATHNDLAKDLVAIVEFCRKDARLNPDLIGVGGTSQAPSWPIPVATSKSSEIRFVIALAGQVGPVSEADLFNLTNRLKRAGFNELEVAEARVFAMRHVEFVKTPELQQEYDQFLDDHREKVWFDLVDQFAILSTPLADPALEQYRQNLDIGSSRDYWTKVNVPVFFGYGEDDHLVDVETSVNRLDELTRDGQDNFEVHVYPSPAGHAIGTSATPTYFRDLRKWFHESVHGPYREREKGK